MNFSTSKPTPHKVYKELVSAISDPIERKILAAIPRIEEKISLNDKHEDKTCGENPQGLVDWVRVPSEGDPSPELAPTQRALALAKVMKLQTRLARNSRRASKRQGKHGRRSKTPHLPPEIDSVVTAAHVFRFVCLTSQTYTITVGNVFGICGNTCTVLNTTVSSWASTVRVKKVTIWPALSSSASLPEIAWYIPLGINKDKSLERSLPGGVTIDAAVSSVPPKHSLGGDWMDATLSASNLLSLNGITAGSIVDVSVVFTLRNNQQGLAFTVASGAVGSPYYLYLDGSTSHQLQPVGVPSTH